MGQNNPSKAVTSVAVLVMICVFYALIISAILGNTIFSNISASGSASNETLSAVSNITAVTVAGAGLSLDNFAMTVTIITNATDGVVISDGNYTATSGGTIIATDAGALSSFNGTDWNVTYSYTYDTERTLSGVNVNTLSTNFGAFITAILAFLTIGGTIIGIVWLLKYVRGLFAKKSGISGMTD